MSEKEIKSLWNQEKFIIDNIKLENASCKGCKNEALKYHNMILDVLSFVIEQKLWGLIK